MDRGGVKPLERDDKPAPENRSDSALDPRSRYYQYYEKEKSPQTGALRSHEQSRSQRAYHLDTSIAWGLSECQILEFVKSQEIVEPPSGQP